MNGHFVPEWMAGYYDYRCRLFSPDACCTRCGVADPMVLSLRSRRLLCRRCDLYRRTGRTTELHHLGGRPSALVVEVDANDHAWLTAYQYAWRGRLAAGSWQAVFCDAVALLSISLGKGLGRGEAA